MNWLPALVAFAVGWYLTYTITQAATRSGYLNWLPQNAILGNIQITDIFSLGIVAIIIYFATKMFGISKPKLIAVSFVGGGLLRQSKVI